MLALPEKKISIFGPWLERINLHAGIVISITVVAIAFSFGPNAFSQQPAAILLASFFFANTLHYLFTFMLIFSVPQLRRFVLQSFKARSLWIFGGFIFAGLLFLYGFHEIRTESADSVSMAFVACSLQMIAVAHAIAQIKGLSLLYGHKENSLLNAKEKDIHARHTLYERRLFDALILFSMIGYAVTFLTQKGMSFGYTAQVLSALRFLIAGGIIFIAIRAPAAKRSNKSLFLVRLVVVAFSSFSLTAALALRAIHGLEYTCLTANISKSVHKERAKHVFAFWILLFILPYLIFTMPRILPDNGIPISFPFISNQLLAVIFGVGVMMEYMHIYLDSVLFKMKEPLVRSYVAPLLTPEIENPATAKQ